MEEENTEKRMREMIDTLNRAADSYYNGRGEVMSDYEWDALFDQLRSMELRTGIVLPDSPTQRVSSDSTPGEKEPHEFPALSLAKTKKPEDLVRWADGKEIWMSWKLDGLTLVVTYDNGRLTKVVTRGDGHIGTNITHLSGAIQGILPRIRDKGHVVIRGEAVISYEDFEKFVMESGEDYANPRNLASGSLTLKDVDEVRRRQIHWVPFTLVHIDHEIVSWGERMQYLTDLGFSVVDHEKITVPDLAHINAAIAAWTKKVTDRINPYPVDGLVIDYDDTVYAQGGSITGHHATRAGYAFKWADEAAKTELDHIEWSCAASTITPVAVFRPVELEGTTVKRASLCNISECERLGIGGKGTKLSVIKANKIIPKVIKVTAKEGELQIPDHCPVCGAPSQIAVSASSGTKTLHCTNPDCDAKKLKKYARFVSKAGMDIDGISEATLSRFINEGWIHNIGDIYRLPSHEKEIAQLDGFKEKSAANITASVQKASEVEDRKLIFALNIPLVGPDVAARLLKAYPFAELVKKAEETDDPEVFSSIDGIGSEKSRAFVSWFKDEKNVSDLEDLLTMVSVKASQQEPAGDLCKDLVFVITGDVYHYKNRSELKAYIESQGGKVTGSVSKKTSYLINNDVSSTSSKNRKARELSIPILSEDDFIARFTKD
jgi:DNA ligase (NAD+)